MERGRGTAITRGTGSGLRPDDTNEGVLRIGRDTAAGVPDLVFGPPYDTRLVVRDLGVEVRAREQGEPSVEVIGRMDDLGVVVTNRWFRSLGEGGSQLREGLRFDLDLVARLTEGLGFSFSAEGALTTRWHLDKTMKLKVLARHDPLDPAQRADPGGPGPLRPSRRGAAALVGDRRSGDAGHGRRRRMARVVGRRAGRRQGVRRPAAADGRRVPAGALQRHRRRLPRLHRWTERPLRRSRHADDRVQQKGLSRWTVTAFGLHELTGSPDDLDRQRSFVLVIGTSFRPGRHIAYGIFWIGAGGIIGIDRRADTDALRERLTSGAVGNILFADDPVRNAPVLLGDLAALFPPRADMYVFGLTMQLGWIPLKNEYLARLAVGVIVEFDSSARPLKIIVLGSLRIAGVRFERFLDIQVDVVGVFDLTRRTLEIDATIRRGVVMGVFKVTGDGGLRASWGDRPYLMATLGGFHPDFHPEPAVFPSLKRILITVDDDQLPDAIELSASGYMAITSNTIQFGAEFTAAIKSGNWKLEGKIGGDALIRLPFYFDVTIKGSVHVKYRGRNLVGVKFKGGLSGPIPLVLRGEVCISLLLFDACWSDSFELGSAGDIAGAALASLVSVLAAELEAPGNLTVAEGEDGLVLIARHDTSDRVVVSPLGVPTWSQNRVPLGLPGREVRGRHARQPPAPRGHCIRPHGQLPGLVQPRVVRGAERRRGAGPARLRAPSGGRDRDARRDPLDPGHQATRVRADQAAQQSQVRRRADHPRARCSSGWRRRRRHRRSGRARSASAWSTTASPSRTVAAVCWPPGWARSLPASPRAARAAASSTQRTAWWS